MEFCSFAGFFDVAVFCCFVFLFLGEGGVPQWLILMKFAWDFFFIFEHIGDSLTFGWRTPLSKTFCYLNLASLFVFQDRQLKYAVLLSADGRD